MAGRTYGSYEVEWLKQEIDALNAQEAYPKSGYEPEQSCDCCGPESHARAMQAARKQPEQAPDWYSVEGLPLWLRRVISFPHGMQWAVKRSVFQDGYEVVCTLGNEYGKVFLEQGAYDREPNKTLYWEKRRTEVEGLIAQMTRNYAGSVPESAWKQAVERPGVMIKAGDVPLTDDPSLARLEPIKPLERTCTTCQKTCDVGVPCWWCGNA